MDYTEIGVWTGVFTGIIALINWISSQRRDSARMYLETVRILEAEFSTRRMYKSRITAAKAFKKGDLSRATNAIDEIIDHFEGVAYYVETKALRPADAWTFSFSYMTKFYHFAHEYIDAEREKDPTIWQGFFILYKKLYKIELADIKKQEKQKAHNLKKGISSKLPMDISQEVLDQFVNEESNLVIE